MSTTTQHDEGAVREQAYLLWEQDGRPAGRETEYWMRAKVLVTGKEQMDTLTKAPPKTGAAAVMPSVKAGSKPVKAAASSAGAAPAKAAKAPPAEARAAPRTKPKKS